MALDNIEFTFKFGTPNIQKDSKEEYERKKKEVLDRLSKYLDDFYETDEVGYNWVTIAIGHDVGIID